MSNDCNVVDEEEEAISTLQARQAEQNQRLRENQNRVLQKVSQVEGQLIGVTSLIE